MIDFNELNKSIAEAYVNKYFTQMKEKLVYCIIDI